MGRHRRTDAGSAVTGRATGRAAAATDPYPEHLQPGTHRHRRRPPYVRTGLLGASAAVAVGAIAVTSGVLPGGGSYSVGGDDGADRVRSVGTPTDPQTLGGTDGTVSDSPSPRAHRGDAGASGSPSARSGASDARSAHPSKPASGPNGAPRKAAPRPATSEGTLTKTPSHTATTKPATSAPPGADAESTAEQQVLSLVNEERGKAGCSPLRSNAALAGLAGGFSEQMADEGFFDHTDPAGLSPWDRAAKAGITGLGGENIARGQADAAAVMESWMNSAGHRANILNCDYRTIGVGVHFGTGGPWWTQDFGF